ncbi:hypothetical protein XELAEV_18047915mg [Xenopus laevis]|uniref:Taste receptor type 2 n=1 Tax=Xenopus laevis TaxID=8355 RepID=A0A974BW33_XENLA|nr:hypothetical protein XELAEV_18047915mg [Xenopus laevis]
MFIMSVNFHSWIKGQSLNPSDLFIVTLAFSNMVFSVTDGAYTICIVVIQISNFGAYQFYVQYSIRMYVLFSNSWLSGCLCFFYFVKVSNFKPGDLAWLKSKIHTLMPRLILGAQVFSILNSLYYGIDDFYNVFFLLINCNIPFLIIVVTTSLIIASLYKHTRHMQQNMGEFGGPSLKIHQRAALKMASLLILCLLFYVVVLGVSLLLKKKMLNWDNYMVGCAFSPIQSIILIMGNTRLNNTCMKVLYSCRKTFSEEYHENTLCI